MKLIIVSAVVAGILYLTVNDAEAVKRSECTTLQRCIRACLAKYQREDKENFSKWCQNKKGRMTGSVGDIKDLCTSTSESRKIVTDCKKSMMSLMPCLKESEECVNAVKAIPEGEDTFL